MKYQMKFWIKQFGWLVLLTSISFFTYWWGWHVSNPDGMSFGRSGAIATAILVFVVVYDYPERLEKVLRAYEYTIQKSGPWTKASESLRKSNSDRMKTELDCVKKAIHCWYATLLLFATMVWGLGDLIFVLSQDSNTTVTEKLVRLMHVGGI